MRNHCKFVFINQFNQLLIKKIDRVYDINVKIIVNEIDNVYLKRYKIIIQFNDFIKIANIDYDFAFFN